jgi:hypothetical protein
MYKWILTHNFDDYGFDFSPKNKPVLKRSIRAGRKQAQQSQI